MNSALYIGHVAHNRPGKHRLRYSVFMLAVDLDELSALDLRLLKHNRGALLSLKDRDHAARADAPLKPQIEAKLREAGIAWDGGQIVMLTMPRLFNYVFNPLTVYFCYHREGELAALMAVADSMAPATSPSTYQRFADQDSQLHDMIAQGSGNHIIQDSLARLNTHLHIFRLRFHSEVTSEAHVEHGALVEALRRRDGGAAEAAMRAHIEKSYKRLAAFAHG